MRRLALLASILAPVYVHAGEPVCRTPIHSTITAPLITGRDVVCEPIVAAKDSVCVALASDTRASLRGTGAFALDKHDIWSMGLSGGVAGNFRELDFNGDGFLDTPRILDVNLRNFWHKTLRGGAFVHFGFAGCLNNVRDGQTGSDDVLTTILPFDKVRGTLKSGHWQSRVQTLDGAASVRVFVPFYGNGDLDLSLCGTMGSRQSTYGNDHLLPQLATIYYGANSTAKPNPFCRTYDAIGSNVDLSAVYRNDELLQHHFCLGLDANMEHLRSMYCNLDSSTADREALTELRASAAYTFLSADPDRFRATAGTDVNGYMWHGVRVNPFVDLEYRPADPVAIKAFARRTSRWSIPLDEHADVLSTFKPVSGDFIFHAMEAAVDAGASAEWHSGKCSASLSYLHRRYTDQTVLDYGDGSGIAFRTIGADDRSSDDIISCTFRAEPVDRLLLSLSGRYDDSRLTLPGRSDDLRPMTSRWNASCALDYSTRGRRWLFSASAALNGPMRVWDFMKEFHHAYADGFTPVYPIVNARITRRGWWADVFVEGENLTGYVQPLPVIGADKPFEPGFDASLIWGPVLGRRINIGINFIINKKKK